MPANDIHTIIKRLEAEMVDWDQESLPWHLAYDAVVSLLSWGRSSLHAFLSGAK